MSLASYKPNVLSRGSLQETTVVSEPKKHEIYDHKETPLWSLDAFLTGSPWEVTYFKQRLGVNDTPKKLDLSLDPAYQSYEKIEKLNLLVQTPISGSYRDKEHVIEVTGSATIYSFITPSVDDYFLTNSNLARLGLFRITNVNRKTFERESVFTIEYSIEKELTEQDPFYQDLFRKTVKTFVFSKQRLIENKNPILLKDTYDKTINLKQLYKNLVRNYFNWFFDKNGYNFFVPGQVGRVHDPLLVGFLSKIVSSNDAPELQRLSFQSLNNEFECDKNTIWTVLETRGIENLATCLNIFGRLNPKMFSSVLLSKSGNLGISDWLIFPKDPNEIPVVDVYKTMESFELKTDPLNFVQTKTQRGINFNPLENVYVSLTGPVPIYNPLHLSETYLFSRSFYDLKPTTVIEILVSDYLKRSPINLEMLYFFNQFYPTFEKLEQFYFGPILMVLLKEADRGAF